MLSLMRKKAGSWIIKVILGIIVIVFVFWGVGSFRDDAGNSIASVNGEEISLDEYRNSYNNLLEQLRRSFGNNLNDEMLKNLRVRRQALDQIIGRKLIVSEAKRLDFKVSDDELAASIQSTPVFQSNGVFDPRIYQSILNRIRTSPEAFEASQRENLLIEKLNALISGGAKVSSEEIRAWYDWNNAAVNLDYVAFSPQRYTDIEVSEEEIDTYYQENKEQYKTEPRRQANFIRFAAEDYKNDIEISQESVQYYYDSHPEEFAAEKTVEARHILLKLDQDADDAAVAEVEEKALEILELARGGEDFPELAQRYSEGPTKDRGGLLGAFKKGDMVAPFADKAFSMAAGEISEPVRTAFGWHLIKVEKVNAASVQSLEQATATIEDKLVDEAAQTRAFDAAEAVYEESFAGDDLVQVAQARDLPVVTTGFFDSTGPEEWAAARAKFATAVFGLDEKEISEVQDLDDGYYLIQMVAEKPAAIPPLAQVSEQVRVDLIANKQQQKAAEDASALIAALKSGETLEEASTAFGVAPKQSGFFKRNEAVPDVGFEPGIVQTAFELSAEKPLGEEAIQAQNGYYALQLIERKLPEADGLAAEKEAIENRLLRQKQTRIMNEYLAELKEKGDVTIVDGFFGDGE